MSKAINEIAANLMAQFKAEAAVYWDELNADDIDLYKQIAEAVAYNIYQELCGQETDYEERAMIRAMVANIEAAQAVSINRAFWNVINNVLRSIQEVAAKQIGEVT